MGLCDHTVDVHRQIVANYNTNITTSLYYTQEATICTEWSAWSIILPICRMQNGQLPHYRPFIQWVQGTLQLITTTLSTVSVYIFTSSANNFRLTPNVFKCSIKSLTKTRMWADAQCDGRPAEYRWCRLRKFRNSIPCTKPQSLADARCWSAMQ